MYKNPVLRVNKWASSKFLSWCEVWSQFTDSGAQSPGGPQCCSCDQPLLPSPEGPVAVNSHLGTLKSPPKVSWTRRNSTSPSQKNQRHLKYFRGTWWEMSFIDITSMRMQECGPWHVWDTSVFMHLLLLLLLCVERPGVFWGSLHAQNPAQGLTHASPWAGCLVCFLASIPGQAVMFQNPRDWILQQTQNTLSLA